VATNTLVNLKIKGKYLIKLFFILMHNVFSV
jgi:hypothetical protein